MKKLIHIILFFISVNSFAQALLSDTSDCTISIIYTSNPDPIEKNLDKKLEMWRYFIKKCPDKSELIYIQGIEIFKFLANSTADSLKEELYLDTLFLNYDLRLKYFNDSSNILARKAMDIAKYRPDNIENAYELFKTSIYLAPYSDHIKYLGFSQASYVLFLQGKISETELKSNYKSCLDNLNHMIELETKEHIIKEYDYRER